MQSGDVLAAIEGKRQSLALMKVEGFDKMDVSSVGILNTSAYIEKLTEIRSENPLDDQVYSLLHIISLFRPNVRRATEVLMKMAQKVNEDSQKRNLSLAANWLKKCVCDHANEKERISIHNFVTANITSNFAALVVCSSTLSPLQFLALLCTCKWSCQLNVSSKGFLVGHKKATIHFWTNIVKKSTRKGDSYTEGNAFRGGFVPEYYDTQLSDNYPIYIGGVKVDCSFFGETPARFHGYSMGMLLKVREELLLRTEQKFLVHLFKSECKKTALSTIQMFVDSGCEEFWLEFEATMRVSGLWTALSRYIAGRASDVEERFLEDFGIIGDTMGDIVLTDKLKIGALSNHSILSAPRNKEFPSLSERTMDDSMNPFQALAPTPSPAPSAPATPEPVPKSPVASGPVPTSPVAKAGPAPTVIVGGSSGSAGPADAPIVTAAGEGESATKKLKTEEGFVIVEGEITKSSLRFTIVDLAEKGAESNIFLSLKKEERNKFLSLLSQTERFESLTGESKMDEVRACAEKMTSAELLTIVAE